MYIFLGDNCLNNNECYENSSNKRLQNILCMICTLLMKQLYTTMFISTHYLFEEIRKDVRCVRNGVLFNYVSNSI